MSPEDCRVTLLKALELSLNTEQSFPTGGGSIAVRIQEKPDKTDVILARAQRYYDFLIGAAPQVPLTP